MAYAYAQGDVQNRTVMTALIQGLRYVKDGMDELLFAHHGLARRVDMDAAKLPIKIEREVREAIEEQRDATPAEAPQAMRARAPSFSEFDMGEHTRTSIQNAFAKKQTELEEALHRIEVKEAVAKALEERIEEQKVEAEQALSKRNSAFIKKSKEWRAWVAVAIAATGAVSAAATHWWHVLSGGH
jgi:hypothetical protein